MAPSQPPSSAVQAAHLHESDAQRHDGLDLQQRHQPHAIQHLQGQQSVSARQVEILSRLFVRACRANLWIPYNNTTP